MNPSFSCAASARWREIAHDSAGATYITANYTFEPRSKNNNRSNIVETLALRRMNAINELEAIEEAHRNIIDERYRVSIYRRFLQSPPAPNWAIGQELGYAKTRFQELVNLACLALLKIIEMVNWLICLNSWVVYI